VTSSLAAAAFAAGLLDGVHCVGMCGGIVASLSVSARGPVLGRQLAFNAGRIGAYAVASAIVGDARPARADRSPSGEQHKRRPSGPALALRHIIKYHPAVATRAIIYARRAPLDKLLPYPLPPPPGEWLPRWLYASEG